MAEQPYVFSGRGNYGDSGITPEALVTAFTETAPACHNPGHYMAMARPIAKTIIGPDARTLTFVDPPDIGGQQQIA